ncbi:MAG: fucose isomerase [Ignavibacteria bacterium]|nr:fucose isomerase [Ignavibacteria bacterium]
MENVPSITMGILAVSRDCFPSELSSKRRTMVVEECKKQQVAVAELETIIERDADIAKALDEIRSKKVNALVLYLGNFGPEGPTTLLAKKFDGPVMLVAAAEESGKDLFGGRGDAYCGLLSASYNVGLRSLNVYVPREPVGSPAEVAGMIAEFHPIARVVIGARHLKIFTFGPRPYDFLTCHAPIKPLFDMGIEIMENSELDMYDIFLSAKDDPRIPKVADEMSKELSRGNTYPELLRKLAQFEIALLDFKNKHLGASKYAVFANKCWPAFEKYFGFVPCFINSRLATRGIPISCEADIYGALSEYMATCATGLPATLLDINNTVPKDIFNEAKREVKDYRPKELFMGFHCGNTSSSCVVSGSMKYQLIMHRLMEPGKDPNITRGTLEGQIRPGDTTIFRLQSTPEADLRAYVAEGEILNVDPKSFGCIAVFAIREMERFYRHVLIEKRFPHHTAVGFAHSGRSLWEATKLLGVKDLSFNRPAGNLYADEHPF